MAFPFSMLNIAHSQNENKGQFNQFTKTIKSIYINIKYTNDS